MLSKSKLDVTYARCANKIDFINRPERLYVLYYIIIILNVTGLNILYSIHSILCSGESSCAMRSYIQYRQALRQRPKTLRAYNYNGTYTFVGICGNKLLFDRCAHRFIYSIRFHIVSQDVFSRPRRWLVRFSNSTRRIFDLLIKSI